MYVEVKDPVRNLPMVQSREHLCHHEQARIVEYEKQTTPE